MIVTKEELASVVKIMSRLAKSEDEFLRESKYDFIVVKEVCEMKLEQLSLLEETTDKKCI